MQSAEDILDLVRSRGTMAYAGEPVSQMEHAWQCGQLARQAGAAPALQLACWLHDIGHLLSHLTGSPTLRGVDDGHEGLGADVLQRLWGDAVAEPVRLHVQAKRYLVATSPRYAQQLSADSVRSLALQGGPMTPVEVTQFAALPHARDAQRLRVWDDLAKDGAVAPVAADTCLDALRGLMVQVAARRQVWGALYGK